MINPKLLSYYLRKAQHIIKLFVKYIKLTKDNIINNLKQIQNMGSCAGCTNPQRYRQNMRKQSKGKKKYQSPPLNIANSVSKQNQLRSSLHAFNYHSQFKPNHTFNTMGVSSDDPWKSKIPSRTIKKYNRQPTLKEEEFKNQIKSSMVKQSPNPNQQISQMIRVQSLEQSIFQRKNLSPFEARQKYKNQFQQRFCEQSQQIKQILQGSSQEVQRRNQSNTPVHNNRLPYSFQSPIYQYDYTYDKERAQQRQYLAKKSDKYRDKQLAEIMQTFQLETHTPGYVKQIKQHQGQDICMDNFSKFEAVPNFQWFSLGKYLEQITHQGSADESKGKKQEKTALKRQSPSLKRQKTKKQMLIQIEQDLHEQPILAVKVK